MIRPFTAAARRGRGVLVPAAFALLGGCAPDLAGPQGGEIARAPAWEAPAPQRAAPVRFASHRYRVSGTAAAVGRAGSAAASVEALAGPGGTTVIVTSHRADDLTQPAGELVQVLVRAFGAGGELLLTRTARLAGGSEARLVLPGIVPGMTLEVQALVRGIDGRRAGVVRVTGVSVVPGPDPALVDLAVPAVALAGLPAIISATVAELGGARGARADCVLLADGVEVDRARDVWVDAGDVVSCAFTATFTTAGTRQLRVELAGIAPLDVNPGNNAAAAALDVTNPAAPGTAPTVTASADVLDGTFTASDTFATRWNYADGRLYLDYATGQHTSGRTQQAIVTGAIGAAVSFPLTRLEVSQSSGGRLLHRARYEAVAADPGGSAGAQCVTRGAGTGATFYLCSSSGGFTTFSYVRSAGTVTYQASEYSRVWNGASYDETTWVDNGTSATGVPAVFGESFDFSIAVTSGGMVHQASARVPLAPFSDGFAVPLLCATQTVTFPPDTFDVRSCFATSYAFTGVAGALTGTGATGPAALLTP